MVTVTFTITVSNIDGLVNRVNNFSDKQGGSIPRQTVAPTGAPNAGYQGLSSKLGKQLL
jgi:hypothetical protein